MKTGTRERASSSTTAASAGAVDAALVAIADPTRRALVRALMGGPRRAGELADEKVAISPPA